MKDLAERIPEPDDESGGPDSDSTRVGSIRAPVTGERRYASLIVVQGLEIGREYRLRRVDVVLGRGEDAPLRLPDERVSRRHARVVQLYEPERGPAFAIHDLGSRNGTYVNGESVRQALLHEGDKVQLGDTVLKFVMQDDLDARFHQEVRYRIAYDQLTGLLNKESLYQALDKELERCGRHERPLSILMMDLDRFKLVNDTHGHLMGSFVLAELGQLLARSFRSSDVAARYGGEEFVAYLAEVGADEAGWVAERIRAAVETYPFTRTMAGGEELTLRVTISIGVAEFPRHGQTRDALIAAADAALYRAKEGGRNRVCPA